VQIFPLLGLPAWVFQSLEPWEGVKLWPRQVLSPGHVFMEEAENQHWSLAGRRGGGRRCGLLTQSNSIQAAKVSLVWGGGGVWQKAEIFAGVYWGCEISEMKTARVNVVLLPLPTPLPKDQCFYTEKSLFFAIFFFVRRVNLELLISDGEICYQPF